MAIIRSWKCLVCGAIVKGEEPPEKCPVCGVGADRFVLAQEPETSFRSSSLDQIIIVGNGAAGFTACEEIRKRNSDCRIEMISSENVVTYFRPMLTKGILQELSAEEFFVKDFNWYKEHSVKMTLDQSVVSIDTQKKQLKLSNGESRSYDKLILATGAECNRLPIPGADQKGVYVIRKLEDINQIREALGQVESAAVIGGGILGLEAAWELAKAGKKTAVFEKGPRIMMNQLDAVASGILRKAAEDQGMIIVEDAQISHIAGNGTAGSIVLEDGREIPAQLIVISAGTKPNVQIAAEAGIETDRFIKVNEKMETSALDVYACGDAASYNGVSIGIWNQALQMGKVAGANAVGDQLTYTPITPSNSYEGMGTKLFSIGDVGRGAPEEYKTIEKEEKEKGIYQKLFFKDGRFCGGILMGDVSLTGQLLDHFEKKSSLEEMQDLLK